MPMPEKIRVQKQRDFQPQHLLMRVAENALEDAEKNIDGWKDKCKRFSSLYSDGFSGVASAVV